MSSLIRHVGNGFHKSAMAALVAVALVGCGGGSSSTTSTTTDTTGSTTSTSTVTASVSGTAAKGIIRGAKVYAYPILADGSAGTTPVGEATTGDDGSYLLDIKDYTGPVLVVLDGETDGAEMKCDESGGCDTDGDGTVDVAFGTFYPIKGKGLTLRAALPDAKDSVSANITVQTTMAAELAEKSTDGFKAANVLTSNAKVANLFGLGGSLISSEVVDITDPTSFKNASEEGRKNALLSAAIYQSAKSQATDLDSFISDYIASGGELVENDDDASLEAKYVSMDDIFEQIGELLDNELSGQSAVTAQWASTRQHIAELSDLGESTTTATSSTVAASDVEKAKAFVQDLRDLNASTEMSAYTDALGAFATEAKMAGLFSTEETVQTYQALGEGIVAILETAVNMQTSLRSVSPYTASNGVLVSFVESDSGTTFAVDQDVDGVAVVINVATGATETALDPVTEDSVITEESEFTVSLEGTATATLAGLYQISFSDLMLAFDGSGYTVDDLFSDDMAAGIEGGFSISGQTRWAQLDGDQLAFTGSLETDEIAFQLEASDLEGGDYYVTVNEQNVFVQLVFGGVALSGSFADGVGNEVAASFETSSLYWNMWADLTLLTTSYYDDYSDDIYVYQDLYLDADAEVSHSEGSSATLAFRTALEGIDDDALVSLALEEGADDVTATLTISMIGKQFTAELTRPNDDSAPTMTLSNSEGVSTTIAQSKPKSLTITLDGTSVATATESAGMLIIRYADGTFETL